MKRNRRKPRGAALLAAGLYIMPLGSATGVSAQRFPGAPGGDGMSAAANQAEYFADVILHTNEVMTEWRGAWAADDLDALVELYTEDAILINADREPVRGMDAIRKELGPMLAASSEVQAGLSDFDASGRMGMISGLITFQMEDGARSRTQTGLHLTVLIRRRGKWRIRSQLFRLDPM